MPRTAASNTGSRLTSPKSRCAPPKIGCSSPNPFSPRAQADAATSPLLLGTVELTGQSHDSILQLVPEVMDGKGMMRFMRQTRLLRAPERQRHCPSKIVSTREASKEKSAQARRAWESILVDLDTGGKILARLEHTEDLKRYLDALIAVANQIRTVLQKRKPSSK